MTKGFCITAIIATLIAYLGFLAAVVMLNGNR